MIGRLLRLRSRQDLPEWPRRRQGALKDERRWFEQLSDREQAEHAAALGKIDRAVNTFPKPRKDAA